MKNVTRLLIFCVTSLIMSSCAELRVPTYVKPSTSYIYYANKSTFVVQNLDGEGQIEDDALTVHYKEVSIKYKITDGVVPTFEIINNTNKSLIIDRSKCYILYNGYSSDLFKDVRISRSTTFNNVQDAINNVQTSDASVAMTIPPYSRWELPIASSNVRSIKGLPIKLETGEFSLQYYDNSEPIEFVIPYSFDYSMAKWSTMRNRIYVGHISSYEVIDRDSYDAEFISPFQYISYWYSGNQKVTSRGAQLANICNIGKYNHWRSARWAAFAGFGFWSGTLFGWPFVFTLNKHRPYLYNSDGTTSGKYHHRKNPTPAY